MNRTIKIFLASSDELKMDRYEFGDLIRKLNDIYSKRGVEIKLIKWEDLDASYQGRRTQDTYNEIISKCDIFMALFYRQAGRFTIEEFNVARDSYDKNSFPKVYTYMRDIADGESQTEELASFKAELYEELGHYWCRYGNSDTMQLHFVMQLQLLESDSPVALEVKESNVMLDNHIVANLENIPFASCNDQYQDFKVQLERVSRRIAKFESKPYDKLGEDDRDDLRDYKSERIEIKKKLSELENALISTAVTIARSQGRASSGRLRRAVELFESGDYRGANAMLDVQEIEADVDSRFSVNLRMGRELVEAAQDGYRSAIAEYQQKVNYTLLDLSNSDRFSEASAYHQRILELAKEGELPELEYAYLLYGCAEFLRSNGYYDIAMERYLELLPLWQSDREQAVVVYNNLGLISISKTNYPQALKYYSQVLSLLSASPYPHIAKIYNNMALALYESGEYSEALEFYNRAVDCGEESDVAISYNGIAEVYVEQEDLDIALHYHKKGLVISIKVLGKEHTDTAKSYSNIGTIYRRQGDYSKALSYYLASQEIFENVLGERHPETAISYNNIASVYCGQKDYAKALDFYFKALEVWRVRLGESHPDVGLVYNNIAYTYKCQEDYHSSLEYYTKALKIMRQPVNQNIYRNVRSVLDTLAADLYSKELYNEALVYYLQAKDISEEFLSSGVPYLAAIYYRLMSIYFALGNMDDALRYGHKMLVAKESVYGRDHNDVALCYEQVGRLYRLAGDYTRALEFLKPALDIYSQLLGVDHDSTNYVRDIISQLESR